MQSPSIHCNVSGQSTVAGQNKETFIRLDMRPRPPHPKLVRVPIMDKMCETNFGLGGTGAPFFFDNACNVWIILLVARRLHFRGEATTVPINVFTI